MLMPVSRVGASSRALVLTLKSRFLKKKLNNSKSTNNEMLKAEKNKTQTLREPKVFDKDISHPFIEGYVELQLNYTTSL
jgi:hypothetical protein